MSDPPHAISASTDWRRFHETTKGREPRPVFLRALELLGPERGRHAIDLGFGDGTETRFLLASGWSVDAIDSEPTATSALRASTPEGDREALRVRVARLEEVELTRADLVYAGYSLPFCPPERFAALWDRITHALSPGGMLAGQLFGPNDTWAGDPDMTFVDRTALDALLEGFDVLSVEEQDEDGDSFVGTKHWHVFHVIATAAA
ncbi:MAG TPA: class I SAM-dependent methyltransferase [Actinomycetota bacterium]|nr:class I SAM-dependent methyltransferase [Actinomycetota bacterium]